MKNKNIKTFKNKNFFFTFFSKNLFFIKESLNLTKQRKLNLIKQKKLNVLKKKLGLNKKTNLKFVKKNFKPKTLDFNLLQEFNFKENFFLNFLVKFKKINALKKSLNLLVMNYKKLKKKIF